MIVLMLRLLELVSSHTMGGVVYVPLVIAIVVVLPRILPGRRIGS